MPGSYVTEERGYRIDRQVAHARLYVNVFLLS